MKKGKETDLIKYHQSSLRLLEHHVWMTNLFNLIAIKGKVPDYWRRSELIPSYKNKDDVAYSGKIWRVVIADILSKLTVVTSNQYGFTSGVSTIDAIHTYKILLEKYKKHHLVFIDLEKTFVHVPRKLI